jgi:hypothetical protein
MKNVSLIILILLFFVAPACEKDNKPVTDLFWETDNADETPPSLSVLPLDLNTVTGMISFGNNLPETKNPTLEYYTNSPDVVLKAVCGGTITNVTLNSNPAVADYSISIKHRANSSWTIIYDHIKSPAVKVGDAVVAGANLGTVGTGNRVELQINKTVHGNADISVCPLLVATQSFIDGHNILRERLAQIYPGAYLSLCNATIVTP